MGTDGLNRLVGSSDLIDCAREPIHVPGLTQDFGVMMAMPAGGERVTQISNNTELIFGVPSTEIVGVKLGSIFGEDNASVIKDTLQAGTWKKSNPLKISIDVAGTAVPVNVILHRYDGLDFVEVEAVSPEGAELAIRSEQLVQNALVRLQQAVNITELWETVVFEVQRITGYDRVMVYKFDRDDHGFVIAESKRDHQEAFLGLHYPASDIPDQARRLYRTDWVRYIPDSHYKPVALIPVLDEGHKRLTDMTNCVLRSVSPIHCEYLHNMGVAASMSVSILRDSRLWGLIACHNDTPKHLPHELRAAFEQFGHVVSIRIAALEDMEDVAYKLKINQLQAKLLVELPQYGHVANALVGATPNLLEFVPATGAAVCFGDKTLTLGRVPEESEIRMILRNTLNRVAAPIFVTDRLQDRFPEATAFVDTASGVLCFTASKVHDFHVLWFRTEQVKVVNWGGEPTKAVTFDGTAMRLSPRRSFEIWKQEVHGQSNAWLQTEIEAATELRSTLMSLLPAKKSPTGTSSADSQ